MGSPKRELRDLEKDFDDDLAKSILEIELGQLIHPQEAVAKSLYNFDLETPEGVDRLLELLPIMDPEIVNEVYKEIFPMYPVKTLSPRVARIELRGYLMDYLHGSQEPATGPENPITEGQGLAGPEEPEESLQEPPAAPEGDGEEGMAPESEEQGEQPEQA